MRDRGMRVQELPDLPQLCRRDAGNVEQATIRRYGLGKFGKSPAGQVFYNQRNSFSPLSPFYERRVGRGAQFLREAGYPGY